MIHTIYTVTALNKDSIRGSRTWGWFPTFERAKEAIYNSDYNDHIFESGTYRYALIEAVDSGILPLCEKTWWYEASYEGEQYKITYIETPEFAKSIINFSMG